MKQNYLDIGMKISKNGSLDVPQRAMQIAYAAIDAIDAMCENYHIELTKEV